jgi:putative transposase
LTAACYEHESYMHSQSRRQQLLNMIFDKFGDEDDGQESAKALTTNITISAWVVLPNHYHLLVEVENFDVLGKLFRKIHGATSRRWNIEDNVTKRKFGILGAIALSALKDITIQP